jgi:hypothetical protein
MKEMVHQRMCRIFPMRKLDCHRLYDTLLYQDDRSIHHLFQKDYEDRSISDKYRDTLQRLLLEIDTLEIEMSARDWPPWPWPPWRGGGKKPEGKSAKALRLANNIVAFEKKLVEKHTDMYALFLKQVGALTASTFTDWTGHRIRWRITIHFLLENYLKTSLKLTCPYTCPLSPRERTPQKLSSIILPILPDYQIQYLIRLRKYWRLTL